MLEWWESFEVLDDGGGGERFVEADRGGLKLECAAVCPTDEWVVFSGGVMMCVMYV